MGWSGLEYADYLQKNSSGNGSGSGVEWTGVCTLFQKSGISGGVEYADCLQKSVRRSGLEYSKHL